MSSIKQIPEEIDEIMSYLSKVFADSMRDSVQDKQDLYQDLVVLYLEELQNSKRGLDPIDKNHWFVFFKSSLVNKYNRLSKERSILEKISRELNSHYGYTQED
jgi:hypothetical protein